MARTTKIVAAVLLVGLVAFASAAEQAADQATAKAAESVAQEERDIDLLDIFGAVIGVIKSSSCVQFFRLRDNAIEARDHRTVLAYNQVIDAANCCSRNKRHYDCNRNSGPVCGYDFRDYANACDACDAGVQYAGTCEGAPGIMQCYNLPMTNQAEVYARVACLSNDLTTIVNHVNLSIKPFDLSLADPVLLPNVADCTPERLRYRTNDGSCNSPVIKYSGMVGLKFTRHDGGYNIPTDIDAAIANGPNPRLVSNLLFRRNTFKPNRANLNGLSFAWLNFFVHDFYNHHNDWNSPIAIPLPKDDPDFPSNSRKDYYMYIPRTMPAHDSTPNNRFMRNIVTSWFDGSQIYGSSDEVVNSMRSFQGGKLKVTAAGLPMDWVARSWRDNIAANPLFQVGDMRANQHAGAQAIHALFILEHNNIATQLAQLYPAMTEEELFGTARLILAAELIKIQTVEISTQLVDDPAQQAIIASVWQGARTRQYNPLATHLTPEDFVSAYRWHAMVPSTIQLRNKQRQTIGSPIDYLTTFHDTSIVRQHGIAPVLIGLGCQTAGWVTLNNVPAALQRLSHPSLLYTRHEPFADATCQVVPIFDLSATDIVRERERGVPRIVKYWKDLGLGSYAPKKFMDLAPTPEQASLLAQLYDWNIDNVDFVVGMMGQDSTVLDGLPQPSTAGFIPFVISRAYSDRFFTAAGFTTYHYTQFGLDRLFGTQPGQIGVTMYQIMLENGVIDATTVPNPAKIFKTWA